MQNSRLSIAGLASKNVCDHLTCKFRVLSEKCLKLVVSVIVLVYIALFSSRIVLYLTQHVPTIRVRHFSHDKLTGFTSSNQGSVVDGVYNYPGN